MSDEIKQENSTYAVKLNGEVKQELMGLLEGYKESFTGSNSGDFIKTLLEVYKTNKIIGNITGGDAELKELNTITNRVYSIYSNLIERNNTNNNSLQGEFAEQLTQKDNAISNVKSKLEVMEQEHEVLQSTFNIVCEDKKELESNNKQLQKFNDSLEFNNSKLVEDTKGIHDLREVNKGLSNQLEEYKKKLSDSQARNIDKDNLIKDAKYAISALNSKLEDNKNESVRILDTKIKEHTRETLLSNDRLEFAKSKALLELKSIHQDEMQSIQGKHNAEIEQYQLKYKLLLEQLEQLRTIPKVKKDNAAIQKNK
jgi:chromosome segregation ATPase